jgi:ATP-dependent Clp protease ATP-binding subunit ClpC
MNDVPLHQLRILVERAVRPVRATMVRKRRMREELLAHLTAIFEEEAARLGDEQAALERAAERFGDPAELAAELQQSVPRWDRFLAALEGRVRPGESPLHRARRVAVCIAILIAAAPLGMLLRAFLSGNPPADLRMVVGMWFVVGTVTAALVGVFLALITGMSRAMGQPDAGRRRRGLWLYAMASTAVLPVLHLLCYLGLTGDLASSLIHCGLACCVAPLAALYVFGLARFARWGADQRRYNEEWASLRIEQ